jgi:hypothetical protein
MGNEWHERATRILTVVFAAAVAVSVVHYADNTINYADYPLADDLPNPSQALVGLSWFLFTGAGLAGYVLFRRAVTPLALGLLAFYSGSGLVGVLHFSADGALDMPPLRLAHIFADIVLGVAMISFVFWAAANRPRSPTPQRG